MAFPDSPIESQLEELPSRLDAHHIFQSGIRSQGQGNASKPSSSDSSYPKESTDLNSSNRPKAHSQSSRTTQVSKSTKAENRAAQRDVRTLPSWIDSYEQGEEPLLAAPAKETLLSSPRRAHPAQHHHASPEAPSRTSFDGYVDTYVNGSLGLNGKKHDTGFFGGHREPVRGRKWDHAREGDPVIMRTGVATNGSPWLPYIKSSMYGPGLTEDGTQVDQNFLQRQNPGYEKPWRGDVEGNEDSNNIRGFMHSKKQRRTILKRIQHVLLMHPLVPLGFRLTVLATSTIALGISGSVFHLSNRYNYSQNPSTVMALVVDVVAIPYILYITWDEYTGKPLGLRSPKAKIRLVLLDLFFIIFESANVALAFAALNDRDGSCRVGQDGVNHILCRRVKALCGILMIALISWGLMFAVSIFRLVERVGGREEDD